MANCPFCDELITEVESLLCEHCGQSFEPPPLQVYGKPAEFIEESLQQVRTGNISPEGLQELFPKLLTSVQGVLNRASMDLSSNFEKLSGVTEGLPEQARKSTDEFIEDFGEIQEELTGTLNSLGELFGSSGTVEEFEANYPDIEQSLLDLQSSVDSLGILKSESENSAMAEAPREELPEEVGEALNHFEKAMDALIRYMETDRSVDDLADCVEQTDRAKAKIYKLVMMNSMS